jgi:hypothetical protein
LRSAAPLAGAQVGRAAVGSGSQLDLGRRVGAGRSPVCSYYNQTRPTPAELREAFLSERGSGSAVQQILDRAAGRGEVDQARLTPGSSACRSTCSATRR